MEVFILGLHQEIRHVIKEILNGVCVTIAHGTGSCQKPESFATNGFVATVGLTSNRVAWLSPCSFLQSDGPEGLSAGREKRATDLAAWPTVRLHKRQRNRRKRTTTLTATDGIALRVQGHGLDE
jgi:hypothetical protein